MGSCRSRISTAREEKRDVFSPVNISDILYNQRPRWQDDHTEYLSELAIGDPVPVVRNDGSTVPARCGRAKIEKRPMLLIKAKHKDTIISIYLQNAGTVHLCCNGKPKPVTRLAVGDSKKAYIRGVEGRHCGMAVDEEIIEK